ncbi:MAG: TIR domain-containing protein [Microcoleus sp. PH2017_01_SCD_O_A]|uniref:nSTAND1 domain-containing NTPase n=1 Tax=Microcoleus sp. PH2017_01_SCD_O_A TaxID=2798812 RepID=UPI001D7BB5F7|nr:TIR domain-containing protein [Microcoleus sp. PH2017_01_SCD_O_A]MCC3417272.1 TIR domain-containing protein [Microcoleus sp. PH2017_07_MST_O_A]MCC3427146.1 TIR domain-containing protein [Microcoleus sp. PH2017_01_SCD_O_A]MCC3512811.1 TIR domain-containing protein [Microcoleus sp. PH2017_17_BER_D_A]TAG68399.1 MAG: TIR domain-containing protein [Oscillatoriales cyanobacterium]
MIKTTKYHLFISYANADSDWVKGYLLEKLKQANIHYHSEETFGLGKPKIEEFENAIKHSDRTLLVISRAYLADLENGYNRFFNLMDQDHGVQTRTSRIIPLILEQVTLPLRLNFLTPLLATNVQERQEAIEKLLRELLQQEPSSDTPAKPPCPYPGIRPFDEGNSHLFFGRDQLIEELIQSLRSYQFIAAIGASGSGKSSLIFAGLIPKLKKSGLFGKGEWLVCKVRPSNVPLQILGTALNTDLAELDGVVDQMLKTQPKAEHLLLVIDQFEELFTLESKDDILHFQKGLLGLVKIPKCYVIITIRADFYGNLMASPLWEIAENHLLNIKPLDEKGLRQAITEPAKKSKPMVFVEPELLECFVSEAAGEPGIMPFVQETLVQLWEKQKQSYLTLEDYKSLDFPDNDNTTKVKGLQAAISYHAKATFNQLSQSEQVIARRIFVRLVQFGEGRIDTRRQQPVDALRNASENFSEFENTLQHLVKHRLLTLTGEKEVATESDQEKRDNRKVDIAHDALINGWPTLKRWVDKQRQAEEERRRLESKAAEWIRLKRRAGLLDAEELLEAKKWQSSSDAAELGWSEDLQKFINVSDLAIQKAEKQKQTTRQRIFGGLITVVLIVSGFGVSAEYQRGQAEFQRGQAEYREKTTKSLQLATASEANLNVDTTRSVLLAIQANIIQETPQAAQALWKAFQQNHEQLQLKHDGKVLYAEFNPINSKQVLTVSDDSTAKIWNLDKPSQNPIVLKGHTKSVTYGNFDAKNPQRVLTVSNDGTARIWDINNVKKPIVLISDSTQPISYGRINPNNSNQVLTVSQRAAKLWDISNPQAPKMLNSLQGSEGEVWTVISDSKNFNRVIISNNDITRTWDSSKSDKPVILTGDQATIWQDIFEHKNSSFYGAVNPVDSNQVLKVSADGKVKIWDIKKSSAISTLYGHTARIRWASFDPKNPKRILTASEDKTARIWDISDKSSIMISNRKGQQGSSIVSASFRPDAPNKLLTVARDGTLTNWDINNLKNNQILEKELDSIEYARIDPNNLNRIATVNRGGDAKLITDKSVIPLIANGKVVSITFDPNNANRILTVNNIRSTATVWDVSSNPPRKLQELKAPPSSPMSQGEFDPKDSNRVATVGGDGIVRIWNLKRPKQPEKNLTVSRDQLWHVSFDPKDSNRIVTMGSDKVARVWDIASDKVITELTGHQDIVNYGSFEPNNSNRVLTVSYDGTARVWDLRNPDNPLILKGHKKEIFYGSFDTNNSNRVITVDSEGVTRIFKIGGKDLLSLSWNNASRCFNEKETKDYDLNNQDFWRRVSAYLNNKQSISTQNQRPYCK